jgi:hypothetical protein
MKNGFDNGRPGGLQSMDAGGDSLVPDHKKMTNKPNFRISKMPVSHFLSKTNNCSRRPGDYKNEPNQSQFLTGEFQAVACM